MGIEKGRPSEQSPKMKGIFYEAMQEKKLSESPKPLILLGFSKSSVSPLAPNQYNPNQIFLIGDGFGLFVYFKRFEDTHFRNGVVKRPESKPRGPRKSKQKTMKNIKSCEFNMDTGCVDLQFLGGSMISIDCAAVENEVAYNRFQRSELDYLIYNGPLTYAGLILNGDPEANLKAVTEYKPCEN